MHSLVSIVIYRVIFDELNCTSLLTSTHTLSAQQLMWNVIFIMFIFVLMIIYARMLLRCWTPRREDQV